MNYIPGPVQHANPHLDVEFFYSQGGAETQSGNA